MTDNSAALTRTLLVAVPIAAFAVVALELGVYVALAVTAAGIIVLVARRRSLPDALVGDRRGRWWVWTLVGLVMVGPGPVGTALSRQLGELGWIRFSLLFLAGSLIVGVSIVRALALLFTRPSTPAV
jgi:hypothetical protein